MAPKQQGRSGLTGAELTSALVAIRKLLEKTRQDQTLSVGDEDEDEDEDEETADLEQLQAIHQLLRSKVDASQNYSFSGVSDEHLLKMNIFKDPSHSLKLRTPLPESLIETDALGADSLWSADMLYRHLQFLEGLVPQTNGAAARLWINAMFYRVASMTPNGSTMVLSIEHGVPPVGLSDQSLPSASGYVSWVALLTFPGKAESFLDRPFLPALKSEEGSILFVSEAKGPDQRLSYHVPQALCEMYACARTVGRSTIRGVLTNGRGWIFLVLTLRSTGGGTYLTSREILIHRGASELDREYVSLVSSIIADWMVHSHEAVGVDDTYFTLA